MCPTPADNANRPFLFLNSKGHQLSHPCEFLKKAMQETGAKDISPTEIRHAVETIAWNNLDKQDRDDVAAALCHNSGTVKRHYVDNMDKKAIRGLDHVANIIRGKTVKTFDPPSCMVVSSSSTESAPCRPRTENEARSLFIKQCVTLSTGDLPSKEAYEIARKRNADTFSGLKNTPYHLFRESCREISNKLQAEAVVRDLGRRRFTDKKTGLQGELEKRDWNSVKCLAQTLREYDRVMELNERGKGVKATL